MIETITTQTYSNFLNRNVPNLARIFDYLAGGTAHYAIDRTMASQMLSIFPSLRSWVRIRRAFSREAAIRLHDEGFKQFLELASGIPSPTHIHTALPDARIVFSDINPIATSYGEGLFLESKTIAYVQADARKFEALAACHSVQTVIDLNEPVAIGLNSLPLFLEPEELSALSRKIFDWAPAGSCLFVMLQTQQTAVSPSNYQTFLEMCQEAGLPMRMFTLEEHLALMSPWQTKTIQPITTYLGLPESILSQGEQSEFLLSGSAAFFVKP
jgi:hypothetical protein